MLTITDGGSLSRALSSSLDPSIKRLLSRRCKQLGGDIRDQACFIIVQPGDTLQSLEAELGFRVSGDPELTLRPEWVANHGGVVLEAVWILTDCGYAHVVAVPKRRAIDPKLVELFTALASDGA